MNALWLLHGLIRQGVYHRGSGWAVYAGQLLVANLCMVGVLLWLMAPGVEWLDWSAGKRSLELGILVSVGVGVYFVALLLSGVRIKSFLAHH